MADFEAAIKEAFADVVADVTDSMVAVIEDPFAFEDLGFSNQDIVLTERLLNSMTVDAQGTSATWEWDPKDPETGYPYAAAVYGGFLAWGNVDAYVPGRPWPERGIDEAQVVEGFAESLRQQGIDARVTSKRRLG